MSQEICISLPVDFTELSAAELQHWAQQQCEPGGQLRNGLDLDPQIPSRTSLPESVTITQVRLTGDRLRIDYEVCLSDFSACAGVSHQFRHQRHVTGQCTSRGCIFPRWTGPPRRDSSDEF